MLNRPVIKAFLEETMNDWEVELPQNINIDKLTEVFCLHVEDDYCEWLKDNAKSFFPLNSDGIDWKEVGKIVKKSSSKK